MVTSSFRFRNSAFFCRNRCKILALIDPVLKRKVTTISAEGLTPVGMKDFTLYPIVRPGSFVQIDPRQKKIPSIGWHGDHDRPIFFFELRDSYVCSWCELHDNDLILVPSHESGRQARHVRYPNDATVVGRVTALSMRIAEAA